MDIIEKPDLPGFRTDNRSTQTRFHFHMDLCIGCHACEVACSEQNGLPVDTQWRRVGEVEGGEYPDTLRFFLSSGCNHCLDAPCAKGCPVDAYKIDERGIVIHQADVCIGCQYCTWNCPYSVPSFQPERGVVSKCDMRVNRLKEDRDPACAQACPAGAIEIETVPLEEVFATYEDAGAAPGMPAPEISMPSTKITLPEGVDPDSLHPVTNDFVEPEEPHSPLIFMTVLTQVGLGVFAAIYAMDLLRSLTGSVQLAGTALGMLAAVLMGLIGLSLAASTLHLGRPAFAFRAIRNFPADDRRFGAGKCRSLGWSRRSAVVGCGSGLGGHRRHLRQRSALSGTRPSGLEFPQDYSRLFCRGMDRRSGGTGAVAGIGWGSGIECADRGFGCGAGLVAYVFLQRYLFFTTVVGTNIAGNFIVEAHRSVA